MKGQELINNAKVRSITDRQSSLRVAWWAFIDRFGAMPGDFTQASIYITGGRDGNGNGYVSLTRESAAALQHLTSAGYLRCPQCTVSNGMHPRDLFPTAKNSLINIYGGIMSISNDNTWNATRGTFYDPNLGRQVGGGEITIHTGPRIPSNIMAELDRKIDDGIPNSGGVVFNNLDLSGRFSSPIRSTIVDGTENCMKLDERGTVPGVLTLNQIMYWRPANSDPPVFSDCGAGIFI